MIIEGKHAEVGQGIFVSDIQEGSNAERVSNKILNFSSQFFNKSIKISGWIEHR